MHNKIPSGLLLGDSYLHSLAEGGAGAFYDTLRESNPVYQVQSTDMWLLSSYSDICDVLNDPKVFSSQNMNKLAQPSWLDNAGVPDYPLAFQDAPQHTQLRKLLSPFFVNRCIKKRKSHYDNMAAQHIRKIKPAMATDILSTLAMPYVDEIYADLIGFDIEGREDTFKIFHQWTKLQERPPEEFTPSYCDEIGKTEKEVRRVLGNEIEKCTTHTNPSQITSYLVARSDQIEQCEAEINRILDLFIIAGLEVIPYTLCQSLLCLSRRMELFECIKKDKQLAYPFAQEILRLHPPLQFAARFSTETVSIQNTSISAGSNIVLVIPSANRDPRAFHNPTEVDIKRNGPQHLSFGMGVHQCLGKHITIHAIASLIQALTITFSEISCPSADELDDYVTYSTHGFNTMPVTFYS
jgi:cytochrome P450